jgi:DNA mismatch endonuclease (patch repair protein)
MADVFEPEIRSCTMSRIRKTNTKPEVLVRSFLFQKGFRFRIHVKELAGNPDIVLPKYNVIVFVNGCFWHAHEGCKYNKMPKSRQDYWVPKILRNAKRDLTNKAELSSAGWDVLTIWECELEKDRKNTTLHQLSHYLKSKNP